MDASSEDAGRLPAAERGSHEAGEPTEEAQPFDAGHGVVIDGSAAGPVAIGNYISEAIAVVASGTAGLVAREAIRQIGETRRERLRQEGETARVVIRSFSPNSDEPSGETSNTDKKQPEDPA